MMNLPIFWKTLTEGKRNIGQQVSVHRCRSLLRQLGKRRLTLIEFRNNYELFSTSLGESQQ